MPLKGKHDRSGVVARAGAEIGPKIWPSRIHAKAALPVSKEDAMLTVRFTPNAAGAKALYPFKCNPVAGNEVRCHCYPSAPYTWRLTGMLCRSVVEGQ